MVDESRSQKKKKNRIVKALLGKVRAIAVMHYRVITKDQMIITISIIVIIADLRIHSSGRNIKKAGTTQYYNIITGMH